MSINARIIDVVYPPVPKIKIPALTLGEAQAACGLIAAGAAPVSIAALSLAEGRRMDAHVFSLMAKVAAFWPGRAQVMNVRLLGYVLVARGDILAALFEAATSRLAAADVVDRLSDSGDAVAGKILERAGE